MTNSPIFVLGNPRSGTTLLRLLLTSHPNITIPPECGFAIWLMGRYRNWTGQDTANRSKVTEFVDEVMNCRKFDTWKLSQHQILSQIDQQQPTNYPELVACVYLAFSHVYDPGSKRWGDKNNFYTAHISQIVELFPDCKLIHIVRDVRDVACSYRALQQLETSSPFAPDLPSDIDAIGRSWSETVQTVLDAFALLPSEQYCHVRYEDLVRHTTDELQRLCEFVGEPYQPSMLDFHTQNRQRELEPSPTLDWKQRTLQPIDEQSVNQFEQQLTADQQARLRQLTHGHLDRFGYLR